MKVFWIVLVLLMLGAAALLFVPTGRGPANPTPAGGTAASENTPSNPQPMATPAPAPAATSAPAPATGEPAAPSPSTAVATPTASAPTAAPATTAAPAPTTPSPTAATPTDAQPQAAPDSKGEQPPSAAQDVINELFPDIAAKLTTATAAAAEARGGDAAALPSLPSAAEGEPVALPDHPTFTGDKVQPSRAVRLKDGTLLVDERFVIRGSGTKEDPYVTGWELIASAQESYKPNLGQTRIPQRVLMLDGKFVRFTGFIAFPITSADPKEMLVMLNQWDGCCIGVPPTPYDAVEVMLASPATPSQRFSVHGSVTGKFKVDPYVDAGWLLGLYLMSDAQLKVDQ